MDSLLPIIIALILGLFAQGLIVVRYLDSKAERRQAAQERRHAEEMTSIRAEIARVADVQRNDATNLHMRVNEVKDKYVSHVDMEREMRHWRESITQLRTDINAGIAQLQASQRLFIELFRGEPK